MALLNSIQNGNNYKSLSSFIVQNKIGKGQFSVVYKALDINENKAVALKKVKISEMSDAKSRLDCLKEVNLLQVFEFKL